MERARELGLGEVAVVDLDRVGRAEVGGEKKGAGGVGHDGQASVDGADRAVVDDGQGDGDGRGLLRLLAVPSGDEAVERGEDEGCLKAVGEDVAGGGRGDGGGARGAAGGGGNS